MSYGNSLAALINGAGGPAAIGHPPAPLGMGTPPPMPGLPPAPTGIGMMSTGDPGTTAKSVADQAILALREAKGYFPNLGVEIDAMIEGLKKAGARAPGAKPPTPIGAPTQPGQAVPDASPLLDSGAL